MHITQRISSNIYKRLAEKKYTQLLSYLLQMAMGPWPKPTTLLLTHTISHFPSIGFIWFNIALQVLISFRVEWEAGMDICMDAVRISNL